MGVTPVEMQVMIPKTVEVARQQSSEMHKVNAEQQNLVHKETQKQEETPKKVFDKSNAERIYVDEQEKEKKEKEKEKKKENNKEEGKDEDDDSTDRNELLGRHFDASV